MENEITPQGVLLFTIERNNRILYKSFLAMLESIVNDHDDAMLKLHASLPPEYRKYVELADYLGEAKCDRLRKFVLDNGNDCFRAHETEMKKYKIEFKLGNQ